MLVNDETIWGGVYGVMVCKSTTRRYEEESKTYDMLVDDETIWEESTTL